MRIDFVDRFFLRNARSDDHAAMNRVCLLTGDSGEDASGREDDPDLLGLIYAVPYHVLEPEFAFVIDSPSGVLGYVLGTPDTPRFYERLEREWFPGLRKRVPPAPADKSAWRGSDWARDLIHHPEYIYPEELHAYPAHGHIDLLPVARGRGIGRHSMEYLMRQLAAAGARGMHLAVSPRNTKALAFYERLGYGELRDPALPEDTRFVGRSLKSGNGD